MPALDGLQSLMDDQRERVLCEEFAGQLIDAGFKPVWVMGEDTPIEQRRDRFDTPFELVRELQPFYSEINFWQKGPPPEDENDFDENEYREGDLFISPQHLDPHGYLVGISRDGRAMLFVRDLD